MPDLHIWIAFVLAAEALLILPGPTDMVVVSYALTQGKRSAWAKAFYLQQRSVGKGHHAALRTLAFKWIRILFRCWKTNIPYSEERYLESLRRRNAPLLAFLIAAESIDA